MKPDDWLYILSRDLLRLVIFFMTYIFLSIFEIRWWCLTIIGRRRMWLTWLHRIARIGGPTLIHLPAWRGWLLIWSCWKRAKRKWRTLWYSYSSSTLIYNHSDRCICISDSSYDIQDKEDDRSKFTFRVLLFPRNSRLILKGGFCSYCLITSLVPSLTLGRFEAIRDNRGNKKNM